MIRLVFTDNAEIDGDSNSFVLMERPNSQNRLLS
jgi:hypothetical protein